VAALARYFNGRNGDGHTTIDFEASGPLAGPFLNELIRLEYENIHYSHKKFARGTLTGEVPRYGGTVNRDGGLKNFGEFERAVLAMVTRVRSEAVLRDVKHCSRDEDGSPKSPKSSKHGHGDYLTAYAGAWWRARIMANLQERDSPATGNLVQSNKRGELFPEKPSLWSDNWVA
jgi:hypothetical protein